MRESGMKQAAISKVINILFGVAVMGALVTTIGRSELNSSLPHVAKATREQIVNALGSGAQVGAHAPAQIVAAANDAFVSALSTGLLVGALVTLSGAVVAWTLIQRRVAAPAAVPAQAAPAQAPAQAADEAGTEISLV